MARLDSGEGVQAAFLVVPLRFEATAIVRREGAGHLADLLERGIVHCQSTEGIGNACDTCSFHQYGMGGGANIIWLA